MPQPSHRTSKHLPSSPMDLLRVLWRVDQSIGTLSRQMLRSMGVTSPQRVALRALVADPSLTAAGLAEVLLVDRSSVTGILRRLEASSLIDRAPHDVDGRKQRIVLTELGHRIDSLEHGTVEAAMSRTVASMDPIEILVVRRFLAQFAAEVERERAVLSELGKGA